MKDIFNGNIKKKYKWMLVLALIAVVVSGIILSMLFLFIGRYYDDIKNVTRIIFFIASGISLLLGIGYSILSIIFVRKYDKYPKIARLFWASYVFSDSEESDNGGINEP